MTTSVQCSLLLFACTACGLPAERLIADFASIHDLETFAPRSPAEMWVPPLAYDPSYEDGIPTRIGQPSKYSIDNHRELDEWMINRMAGIDLGEFPDSLGATAWLVMALLHDVHPGTRLQAAAVLSQFAGGWSAMTEGDLGGQGSENLAHAIDGILASVLLADTDGFDPVSEAAFTRLADAPIADPYEASRLIAGLALHLRRDLPLPDDAEGILARLGLRTVVLALQNGCQDPNAQVAAGCRARLDLLKQHLQTH